jgi:hypothetical protein
MMQTLKLQVSLMRLLGRVKAAFANAFAIHHDLHKPFSLVWTDPQKPRLIGASWFSHVLQITKSRDFAKVVELVVLFVSIAVVYVKHRKRASHVQPRKPMGKTFLVVDCNRPVPGVGWATSTFTDKIRAAVMRLPDKITSLWVVIKDGSNMVSGNHEFEFTIGVTK